MILTFICFFALATQTTFAEIYPDDAVEEGSIAKKGMPDDDHDGIPNRNDRCRNTPSNNDVNALGCASFEVLEISLYIDFLSGGFAVDPEFHEAIGEVASFMRQYPETTATIEGHTDNTGRMNSNMRISMKRAESVANYLVKRFKIDPKRLKAVGYGPKKPIANNRTPAGRRKNRRVVAIITANTDAK